MSLSLDRYRSNTITRGRPPLPLSLHVSRRRLRARLSRESSSRQCNPRRRGRADGLRRPSRVALARFASPSRDESTRVVLARGAARRRRRSRRGADASGVESSDVSTPGDRREGGWARGVATGEGAEARAETGSIDASSITTVWCGRDGVRTRSFDSCARAFVRVSVRSFVRVSGGGAERGGAPRARRTRTHSSQFGSFSSRAYTGRSCMCANVRAVSSALCPRPLARERDAPCPSRHRVLALGGDDGGLSGGVAARADARRIASYSSSDFNSMVGERFRSLAAGAAREDVVVVSPSARRHRSVGRRGAASARIQTTSGRSARASVDATRATRDSARESTRRKNIHPPIHPSAGAYLESSRARAVCRRRAGRCPFRVGALADRVDGYVCLKHTTVR